MNVLTTDRIIKISFGAFISGIVSGVFTFFFISRDWQSYLLGFIIGIQAYIYTSFFSDFLMKHLRQRHIILSLFLSALGRMAIIFFALFISFEVLSSFKIGIVSFFSLLESIYDKILTGLIFGLTLSFIFDAYELFDTLLGKNLLISIIAGKYNHPIEEELFFMFLDLTSSTAHAEKLGHKKYLMLLNDFFHDLAGPVSSTGGQIYKYVGDEAIITWSMKRGKIRSAPLRCFFMMRGTIAKKGKKYFSKYGIIPAFRAGLHAGIVVTGEIGLIKKEISHIGDVINTTSRITEICKEHDRQIISSNDAIAKMKLAEEYEITPLEEITLRGKTKFVPLSSVELKNKTPLDKK